MTSSCDAWWGVNDKMAFKPVSRASDFFKLPFEYYWSLNKVISNLNPEQLYKNCYVEGGFNLTSSDDFVVTKAVTKAVTTVISSLYKGQSRNNASNGKICSISGNSHQKVKINHMCPKRNESSFYTAVCHPPSSTSM